MNFPHAEARRPARPAPRRPVDFAALVARLAASQAISTTARAEELAARRPANDDQAHAALLRIFAPRRSERGSVAILAGSFHLATAQAIASTTQQPE